jgi:hypothetical protein
LWRNNGACVMVQELLRQRGEWAELAELDRADKQLDKYTPPKEQKIRLPNMDDVVELLEKPPEERTSKVCPLGQHTLIAAASYGQRPSRAPCRISW